MENEDPDYTPQKPDKDRKYCPHCQTFKAATEFYFRGKRNPYLTGYCKACHNVAFRDNKIKCPHCNHVIAFVGLNKKNEIVKKKANTFLNQAKKEAKKEMQRKKSKSSPAPTETTKTLRDIFK